MKIIDCSLKPVNTREMSVWTRLRGTFESGFSWYGELQSEENTIAMLGRYFDNRFTLLHNVAIPGLDISIPMVLIGPSGVQVLYPLSQKGVYRAKAEEWLEADSRQNYSQSQPNLIKRVTLMASAVKAHLERSGFPFPKIEPVLLCTDPGVHVESVRPVVRVVLSDAIDRFAASLMSTQAALGPEHSQKLISLLGGVKVEQAPPVEEEPVVEEERKPAITLPQMPQITIPDARLPIPSKLQKVNMTKNQVIVLAVMAVVEIVVVIAFLFYVFASLQ
jgi:hypothetical protein